MLWSILMDWATVGVVFSLLIGAGVGVLSMSPPEFLLAKVMFTLAAVLLMVRIGWWGAFGATGFSSGAQRIIFVSVAFGVIGAAWVASTIWIHGREPAAAQVAGYQLTVESRRSLVEALAKDAGGDANVKVFFANVRQKPLAEGLISAFRLAGWQTNLTNVPLEAWRHEYLEGIEVLGHNRHLVEAVAQALGQSAALMGVVQKFERHQIKRDNPKWGWAEHSITITIGHEPPPVGR